MAAEYIDNNLDTAFMFWNLHYNWPKKIRWDEGIARVKIERRPPFWRKRSFETALKYHNDDLAYFIKENNKDSIAEIICLLLGRDYAIGENKETLRVFCQG